MGEAKRRGTFEQRRDAAIRRTKAMLRPRSPMSPKYLRTLRGIVAMMAPAPSVPEGGTRVFIDEAAEITPEQWERLVPSGKIVCPRCGRGVSELISEETITVPGDCPLPVCPECYAAGKGALP